MKLVTASRWATASMVATLLLLGCSSDPLKPRVQSKPPLANNNTPANTVARFIGAYEQKKTVEYADLFTADFTYEFSNTTDPDLVTKYAAGWLKADEKESSSHLFQGYALPGGLTLQAASSIDVNFQNMTPADDNGSVDPETHKVLLSRVDGSIVIPPGAGQTESTTYLITDNQNAIYLVRGDRAVALDSGQPDDDTHWYIYRWVDLTQATTAPSRASAMVMERTWGGIKAIYR